MTNKRGRENPPEHISWHIHERDLCRLASAYRAAIRVLVAALVLAVAFAAYEAYLRHEEHGKWLDYLGEYDFQSYDYTQDGHGVNIIGNENGVDFDVPKVESEDPDQEEPRNGEGQSAEKDEEMSSETESQDEV